MRMRSSGWLRVVSFWVGLGFAVAAGAGDRGGPGPDATAPAAAVAPTAPAGVGADWLTQARRHVAEREYHASRNDEGLQAPNRAHALRTYFEKTGIRVHDRTAGGSPELLRLSLSGVGRGASIAPRQPGSEIVTDGNRVEIRRPGLVEWYVNSPEGLEQGFTLGERPEGEGALVVELAARGARASLRGDGVVFTTGAQRRLAYGKLAAFDSEGRALASYFELVDEQRLRIVVDDAEAVYPVVIDPLLTEAADAQLESDQASALLGFSVAGAGDVNGDGYADVIVGAPSYDSGQSNEGAAFVFLGSATGIADGSPATAAAQLESDQAGAQLGFSVAGAGDVNGDGYADVIVGASSYDAGQSNEGAAFVFLGSAAGIADGNPSTAAAQLESDQVSGNLGTSVAGAGDVNGDGYDDVIVGAMFSYVGEFAEGTAFVFLGSATGVADGNPSTAAAQLEANQANARMGQSVAGAGDVNGDGYADVIVGASDYDAGQSNEGAAFVFLGSATGIADGNPATAAAQLESDQVSGNLGTSVAGAGDVNGDGYADVIVGAWNYDAGETNEGAAFVFLGSATGIADGNPATAATQIQSNQASAGLGYGVAGAGDVNGDGYADVVVGARAYDSGQTDEGAVFVFLGGASGVAPGSPATAAAQLESDQAGAQLGFSVASAGDVNGDGYADVIAGALDQDAGQTDEGAAFVFHGGASGILDGNPATAAARVESNQASAELGDSVAGAGDVNRDGFADLIIGAPHFDGGQTLEGAAFVFLGSATGIATGDPATADAQLESNQVGALFGSSVASAGDVNGDGYADVIVGAYFYDAPQTDEGAAFVFHGSATGVASGNPSTAKARLESNESNGQLGGSVASAGDVNGDGYADVIVGADHYGSGDPGAAFVFHGSATGVASGNPATANARIDSLQSNANLGDSVASAGDVNGDGYADVIVGAPEFFAGNEFEGVALVFHGSATGIESGDPTTADALLESNQQAAYFGDSVAGAGDVNGDGYADVIVGASGYRLALPGADGAAFVFHGSAAGIGDGSPATAAARIDSNQSEAWLGRSVAGAGDVNGDGYADVIVGADQYDAGQIDEGAAFVFLGSASGIGDGSPATAAAQLESDQSEAWLGGSVAGAGDVNGDGYADVIVGADYYTAGQADEGAAFLFLGNGEGRPVLTRQRRGDGIDVPVQPWGDAGPSGAFEIELRASHPQGTGRVRGEFEACATGVPFGDASCTRATTPSWVDVDGAAPEVLLSQTLSPTPAGGLYRWRARVLHAPKTGALPAKPAHGPWRRVNAQAVEADIRTVPEPVGALGIAAGMAWLAGRSRRRGREADRSCGG